MAEDGKEHQGKLPAREQAIRKSVRLSFFLVCLFHAERVHILGTISSSSMTPITTTNCR
jgi:hypothetical protein